MGWHLDGRVAAVLGTHTHVPTADAPGAAQGHRVHLRRRHDRLAHQRARGQARAGAGVADHPDAGPVRDRRRGRLGDGRGGRGQRRGAGRLDRAGDGSGSVRSGRSSALAAGPRPSADQGRHQAAAGRTRRCRGRTSGASVSWRAISSAAPRAATWTSVLRRAGRRGAGTRGSDGDEERDRAGVPGRDLAPDAERRVAAGLVGDRAVVEGVQAGVDRGPEHHCDRDRRRRRRRRARLGRAPVWPVGQRASGPGAPGRTWRRSPGPPSRRGRAVGPARRRVATRSSATRVSLEFDSRAKAV